ncbi:putative hydroxyacid oxidoreductase (Fe-S centre) [Candidatus Desulfarcum epimagneticum]|uniref:Putative hydroxyacid oxidoreductase (Fe-S centre) n=1 Tax=uncultured Desulfobacteraceae bacterium TaxID=218296 RepID=A0A484HMF9_9BACT|nr:putative hydroxyacid oxidoreductase (Fe-S centre) [uncultured Desulfobacteraceae bacterium]
MKKPRVSFFATCLIDALFPEVGKRAVRLLETLGCDVYFNPRQTCCGQPLSNAGFRDKAKNGMRHLISALLEDDPDHVVAPSGSCVLQVREYPEFFKNDPHWGPMAETLAARTFEITDFIVNVLGAKDLGARLAGKAAYHPSCHMTRRLGVKDPPLVLLKHIQDLEIVPFEGQARCCGFGGAFSVKMGALSGAMAGEKADHLFKAGVDYLIGADAGCLMNLEGRIRRRGYDIKVLHIVEALGET